jgi:hypothetical protein
MDATHLFAGIPVTDYEAAIACYERLLGRAPDVLPTEGGPGGMPTAVLDDPDGNRIKVFEDPRA